MTLEQLKINIDILLDNLPAATEVVISDHSPVLSSVVGLTVLSQATNNYFKHTENEKSVAVIQSARGRANE